jgi:competence protein ComK
MKISKDYMINEETVLFTGEYDEYGNLCTRIIEGEKTFVLKESPVEQIEKTLLSYGSDFNGALNSSKHILGPIKMHPIKINEKKEIWLFPTKSFKKKNCVWFNLYHIINTEPHGAKTKVFMSYGHTFMVNMKESAFNHKRQKALQLRESILKNDRHVELKRGFQICEVLDSIQIVHTKPRNEIHSKQMN